MVWEELLHYFGGPISRCQEGGRCKNGCTPKPRPPVLTGRVACSQDDLTLLKSKFVILETVAINSWSQDFSSGEVNAGDVRKMWSSLGINNELRRMVMASCICR